MLSSDGLLRRVRGGGNAVGRDSQAFMLHSFGTLHTGDGPGGDALTNSGADPGTLARMTNAGTEVLST